MPTIISQSFNPLSAKGWHLANHQLFVLEEGMFRFPRRSRKGFTLIELLVVIAIIAILIALLVPAVQKVRFAAARAQSTNNLKQLALGAHTYHDSFKFLPYNGTALVANASNNESGSWGYQILPYIEQGPLYSQQTGSLLSSWTSPLQVFCCPMRGRPGYVSGSIGSSLAISLTPLAMNPFRPDDVIASDVIENIEPGELFAGLTGARPQPVLRTVNYSGPATDYVINPFVNEPATRVNLAVANKKQKLITIGDGTSNTIFVGHGYVALADYPLTNPVVGTRLPIFNGGQLATGRNGTGDPTTWRRDAAVATSNQWGSPMSEGGLMGMADGTVRMFPYTTNLLNYLLPSDGSAVTMPD
jgi:prepilin-type N-terminal cleavage/methylation domain-containing protein